VTRKKEMGKTIKKVLVQLENKWEEWLGLIAKFQISQNKDYNIVTTNSV